MRGLGTVVAAALGAWLAGGAIVMLPDGGAALGLALGRPHPWLAGGVVALVALCFRARTAWPALASLGLVVLPLLAPSTPVAWVYAGSGVGVIWFGVGLGAACASFQRSLEVVPARWAGAGAIVAGLAWLGGVAVLLHPVTMSGDAPHYLTATQSLLTDGDLDLRNNYDERSYQTFYEGSLEPRHTNTSPWGEDYPFHGLGVSALVAPGMAAFGIAGATATLVLLMALGGGMLWWTAWELTRDAGAAWFAWGALMASAPYAVHAAAIYPDGPAAVAVTAALWLMVRLQAQRAVPLWALAAGSVGLAALPWLHVRLALPAGIFGIAITATILRHQPERWTRVSWFLTVPIPSAAAWLASTYVMFGTWNPALATLQRTAPGQWDVAPAGLLGLLADREYGLFPAAPVMLAAVAAWPAFARTFPIIGASTALATIGVLGMSSLWVWWGGDSAPARFLVVVLPTLALWLAHLWARSGVPARRLLSIALAITATMTVLYATVDDGGRAFNFPDGRGSIFEGLSRSVDVAQSLPALHRPGATAATELPLALIWLAGVSVAALAVIAVPVRRDPGVAWAISSLMVGVGIAMTVGVGWNWRAAGPWTPGSAAHTLLRALAAPDLIVAASSWPPAVAPSTRLVRHLRLTTPESLPLSRPLLLYVPNLPAGDYQLHATPRPGGATGETLSLELGRDATPFATWSVGSPAPSLSLTTDLHSLRVVGSTDAELWLEPVRLRSPALTGQARRITRLGDVAMYSMDDNSYVEGAGAWIGGDRASEMLLTAPPDALVSARLEAGPAPVRVRLDGGWGTRQLTLDPNAKTVVPLAVADAPMGLRVTVDGGFPARDLGNSSDLRLLGVWIGFEAQPAAPR